MLPDSPDRLMKGVNDNISLNVLTSLESPVQYSGTSQSDWTARHNFPCFLNYRRVKHYALLFILFSFVYLDKIYIYYYWI